MDAGLFCIFTKAFLAGIEDRPAVSAQ